MSFTLYKHTFPNGKVYIAKSVVQLDDSGNVVKEWESISDACRVLGIKNQSINSVLHGRRKHAGGYTWRYK